jgi:hypothetical protein
LFSIFILIYLLVSNILMCLFITVKYLYKLYGGGVYPHVESWWNNDARWTVCSWPGGTESRLNGQSLVKKWHVAAPNIIFAKNQELVLLPLKCKTIPVPAKSAGAFTKSKIYLRVVPQRNESLYVYPRWSIIYAGCCSKLSILRFGSRFTKKPNFGTLKMEKVLFVGQNENQPPRHSSPSHVPRACLVWPHSDKLCHDQSQT